MSPLVVALALGIPLTLVVNWLVFALVAFVAAKHPGIRTLADRSLVSLGIALSSSALSLVVLAVMTDFTLGADFAALLLTAPLYVLTGVNILFLVRTVRGKW